MHRAYLPPAAWTETPHLAGSEAKHLAQVLRVQEGQIIEVFDGEGNRASAKIVRVSKSQIDLVLEVAESDTEATPRIILAQSVPKGRNMDLIIQKSVELGVAEIHPLITQNSVSTPAEEKVEKWQRIALEACKQCGQDTVPLISPPIAIEKYLEAYHRSDLNLIASLTPGAQKLPLVLDDDPPPRSATLLIGPEGDFSPRETSSAIKAGFIPVTLGPLVLRVETASIFSISAIRARFM